MNSPVINLFTIIIRKRSMKVNNMKLKGYEFMKNLLSKLIHFHFNYVVTKFYD